MDIHLSGNVFGASSQCKYFNHRACIAAWLIIAATGLLSACHRTPPMAADAIGTLAVLLPESPANAQNISIEVPDAKMTLINASNVEVAHAATNLAGQFRIKGAVTGKYKLCWDIQGSTGCRDGIELIDAENYLGKIAIRLKEPLLYGRVLTGDGRACWVTDPFFQLDVATKVDVTDNAGNAAAQPVRANVHGDYLFPMKSVGDFAVHAQCEAAEQKAAATLRTGAVRADLNFTNHAPRLVSISARAAGKGVVRVAPGASVELAADVRDRDGDTVEYLWRDVDGQAAAPITANSLTRVAPTNAQRQTTYLMTRDGHGGFTYKRFDMEVGDDTVQYSGTVLDEVTHAPVANAQVQFGATTVTTNAQGWFNVGGPVVPGDRYVVNVRHPDYALLSRVFDRSARSNVFELMRAQIRTLPVNAPIDLVDTDSSGPCGTGKGGDNPTTGPATGKPNAAVVTNKVPTIEYVDPDAGDKFKPLDPEFLRKLTAPRQCEQLGAQISIAAGALEVEGAAGTAPTGTIRAAMTTHDPTRRALPGDARAIDSNGRESELLSYGAVYAEFRDASNHKLNLKAGATADITIPVPPQQRSTAKPSIDFWSYVETTGKWQYEGKAVLKNTPTGPAYVAKTKHFSYLNMDVAGNDPATATCIRFTIDPSLTSWSNLRIRSTVSYNGNQVITKETTYDGAAYNAIFRIPYGTSFPPNTVRLELFGEFSGHSVALVDNVINTDARPKMTGTNLWPNPDYTECGNPIVLAPASGVVPQYASNDATNRPYFLTGPTGGFLPDDPAAVVATYYPAIGIADPDHYKLSDWWAAHGFNADGTSATGYARAAYLNHNDLGFGRDMHCKKSGSNLACYVTNYGAPNQQPSNADAALAQDSSQRGATVAMTYDSSVPAADSVQFYVFSNKGSDPADPYGSATMLKYADLDGFGPKPVPHLCMVCHGGNPGTLAGNKVQHSRFREFDLPSFRYPTAVAWDYGQATPAVIDPVQFGSLNQMVRDATPATAPINKLINAWYPGNNFTTMPQLPTPPGNAATAGDWANAANVDGYHNVYGKTCRTCHVARDSDQATPPYITFNTKTNFAGTSYAVCGKDYRVMPNAIITYKNFWLDTPRVTKYEILTGVTVGACQNDTL